jgi:ketosteroid isomerase-like protein
MGTTPLDAVGGSTDHRPGSSHLTRRVSQGGAAEDTCVRVAPRFARACDSLRHPAGIHIDRSTVGSADAKKGDPMANNEDIVRQGYKAFGEGDLDTLRSLFAPDAVHVATGNNPVAGEYKGVDDILAYYGRLFELSNGTFAAELQSTQAEGDRVIAKHRNKGQRGDKTLDHDETLTFTLEDGKFTRLEEEHSDPAAYDDFWS